MSKKLLDAIKDNTHLKVVGNFTVRDHVFSVHSRFCWNPDCQYLVPIQAAHCLKCCWTAQGPMNAVEQKPAQKARTRAPEVITERTSKMNKTEQRYEAYLAQEKAAGRIQFHKWEAQKMRIGPDCFYTADFLVVDADGFVELHDTKAFWKSKGRAHIEDDARVKMVALASAEYPVYTIVAVWEKDGVWHKKVF